MTSSSRIKMKADDQGSVDLGPFGASDLQMPHEGHALHG